MIGVSLIPIVIGFFKLNELNKELKLFWAFRILMPLINFLIWLFIWLVDRYYDFFLPFLTRFNIQNTYFLSILSYLTQIYFIGLFYSMLFHSSMIKRITMIYFFCAILIYFFIDGYQEYGSVNALLIKIFIIVLSFLYFNKAFITGLNRNFLKNPYVLISLGLLLPNVFQVLFSLFVNDLNKTNFILSIKLKILTNFIDFIGYFLFSLAFLRASKNLKIS